MRSIIMDNKKPNVQYCSAKGAPRKQDESCVYTVLESCAAWQIHTLHMSMRGFSYTGHEYHDPIYIKTHRHGKPKQYLLQINWSQCMPLALSTRAWVSVDDAWRQERVHFWTWQIWIPHLCFTRTHVHPMSEPLLSGAAAQHIGNAVASEAQSRLAFLQKFREEKLSNLRPLGDFFDRNRISFTTNFGEISRRWK